ncbi:33580_t:CDS:2 [Gigaspora margarita]|uniref:33580_t:CDS:1 n=1 Tax=Gigaspora margarita TaxID=4874 RepID=A0ABN7VDC9_GIGMA|nr:33580_t:CDS:2 [Gigaspora margarita]
MSKEEVIEDAIIKVGQKVLLSKDIKNELEKQNPRPKKCRDLKAIKLFSILISAIRKNRDSKSVADWRKWNKSINQINQLVEIQISLVQSNTVEN